MTELILADLLYMTGLGMTMLFLFVKSRLSQRKTALIFAGTGLALMAAVLVFNRPILFAFGVVQLDYAVKLQKLFASGRGAFRTVSSKVVCRCYDLALGVSVLRKQHV